jgi:hypothetical protein
MSLWMKPKYFGDAVRGKLLKRGTGRGTELGGIRIEQYEAIVRVAAFLPRLTKERHFLHAEPADELFDKWLGEAYEAGWQNVLEDTPGDELTIDWSTGGRG